jgi:hypothetical protein
VPHATKPSMELTSPSCTKWGPIGLAALPAASTCSQGPPAINRTALFFQQGDRVGSVRRRLEHGVRRPRHHRLV